MAVVPQKSKPCILLPFDTAEACTVAEAAEIAGRTSATVRSWAALYDIGRLVGGQWRISKPALAMYLDGDRRALAAYLVGDRETALVLSYFRRFDIDVKKISKEKKETQISKESSYENSDEHGIADERR